MKNIILLLSVLTIFLSSCNNSGTGSTTSSTSVEKSPEELKLDLKTQEQNSPTDYLTADGTYRENFWGDKLKINCTITNSAALATFKDATVRVTYFSKTKTKLGDKELTVYEIFPPNSSKTIELKIDNYKDVNSIGWDVISALPVD
jgi:hypothetical protein